MSCSTGLEQEGTGMNLLQRRLAVWLLTAISALLLSSCGVHTFVGTVIEPPKTAADFTLTDQRGQAFRLSEQKGNVVVMFFGFTHCPDICPTELAALTAVRRQLGADSAKLRVVFITVDPERDTPEIMGQYVKNFDASFIGLSGQRPTLETIYQAYGVTAIRRELPNSALGYTMDHSAIAYVVDAAGNLRLLFPHGTSANDMLEDIRSLIRNG